MLTKIIAKLIMCNIFRCCVCFHVVFIPCLGLTDTFPENPMAGIQGNVNSRLVIQE